LVRIHPIVERMIKRIITLEQKVESVVEQKDVIDRWTDPKNAMCLVHNLNINFLVFNPRYQSELLVTDYLLKPLPHYVDSPNAFLDSPSAFLINNRTEYLCSCYNCILLQLYKVSAASFLDQRSSGDLSKMHICPLDSECTCMTRTHRNSFLHSIESGYIKGKDKELSPIQRYCATNVYRNVSGNSNGYLVCIPTLNGLSVHQDGTVRIDVGGQNQIFYIIENCIKRDGVEMYQYVTPIIGTGKYKIHEITSDKLYAWTNQFDYPPRDPATFDKSNFSLKQQYIFVPIEKYMADTMVNDRFFLGKVKQRRSKNISKNRSKRTKKSKDKKRMST